MLSNLVASAGKVLVAVLMPRGPSSVAASDEGHAEARY